MSSESAPSRVFPPSYPTPPSAAASCLKARMRGGAVGGGSARPATSNVSRSPTRASGVTHRGQGVREVRFTRTPPSSFMAVSEPRKLYSSWQLDAHPRCPGIFPVKSSERHATRTESPSAVVSRATRAAAAAVRRSRGLLLQVLARGARVPRRLGLQRRHRLRVLPRSRSLRHRRRCRCRVCLRLPSLGSCSCVAVRVRLPSHAVVPRRRVPGGV